MEDLRGYFKCPFPTDWLAVQSLDIGDIDGDGIADIVTSVEVPQSSYGVSVWRYNRTIRGFVRALDLGHGEVGNMLAVTLCASGTTGTDTVFGAGGGNLLAAGYEEDQLVISTCRCPGDIVDAWGPATMRIPEIPLLVPFLLLVLSLSRLIGAGETSTAWPYMDTNPFRSRFLRALFPNRVALPLWGAHGAPRNQDPLHRISSRAAGERGEGGHPRGRSQREGQDLKP